MQTPVDLVDPLPSDEASAPRPVTISLTPPQAIEATSALVWEGIDPAAAAIILAHGAGTTMDHRHMRRHAADLVARGHTVALFNFAYTEMGRSRPDPAPRLQQAWIDVIAGVTAAIGTDRPLVIGGRSMGGRIASMLPHAELGVAGVACIAYPLHPPGRPEKLRVAHWPALTVPILLVSGDRDSMAPLDALRDNVAQHMPPGLATVHVVAGADHSYRVRKRDGRTEDEVLDEVADTITEWAAASVSR